MLGLGCHYTCWVANLFVQTAVMHILGTKSVCLACSETPWVANLYGLQCDTPWVANLSVWPAVRHTLGGKSAQIAVIHTLGSSTVCTACDDTQLR